MGYLDQLGEKIFTEGIDKAIDKGKKLFEKLPLSESTKSTIKQTVKSASKEPWKFTKKAGMKLGKHVFLPLQLYGSYETLTDPDYDIMQKGSGVAEMFLGIPWLVDALGGNAYKLYKGEDFGSGWDIPLNIMSASLVDEGYNNGYYDHDWYGFKNILRNTPYYALYDFDDSTWGKIYNKESQYIKDLLSGKKKKDDRSNQLPQQYFVNGQRSLARDNRQTSSTTDGYTVPYSGYQINPEFEAVQGIPAIQETPAFDRSHYYDNAILRTGYQNAPRYVTIPKIGGRLT